MKFDINLDSINGLMQMAGDHTVCVAVFLIVTVGVTVLVVVAVTFLVRVLVIVKAYDEVLMGLTAFEP